MGCTASSEAQETLAVEGSETTNIVVETLPEIGAAPLPPKVPCPPPTLVFKYFKLGHHVKSWKLRYFLVDEGMLRYYESEDAYNNKKDKLGEIILQGFAVTTCTVEGKSCISIDREDGPSTVVFLADSPKKSLSNYIFGTSENTKDNKNLIIEIPNESDKELITIALSDHIAFKNYEVVEYPKLYHQYEVALAEYNEKINPSDANSKLQS